MMNLGSLVTKLLSDLETALIVITREKRFINT